MYGTHIETRKSQRWERGVYGIQVSKINYRSIRLPLVFRPRNFNIKIGPGDEANLEVDEPHEDGITIFVMKGGGWMFGVCLG